MSDEASVGRRLPMFPLGTVLFPGEPLPLHVFEPRYRELMADCLAGDREFGVVLIERGHEVGGGDTRANLGTVAYIEAEQRFDDGRYALLAVGLRRIRVVEWLPDDPYPCALVVDADNAAPGPGPEELVDVERVVRRARALLSELDATPPLSADLGLDPDPDLALWQLVALAPISAFDRQRLLGLDDGHDRVAVLIELVNERADDLERLLAAGST